MHLSRGARPTRLLVPALTMALVAGVATALGLGAGAARADDPDPGPDLVTGVLRDPVGGASERWIAAGTTGWSRVDADGRFTLLAPAVPARLVVLQRYGDELSSVRLETAEIDLAGRGDLGVLDVTVPQPVILRVVDSVGQPVPGAFVTQTWSSPRGSTPAASAWEHARQVLAPGLPVDYALLSSARHTDARGEVRYGYARTAEGGLVDGQVSYALRRPLPQHRGRLADAVVQPDGSVTVTLPTLVLPPVPGPVRQLTATPADRGVRLEWVPPQGAAESWTHFEVTDPAGVTHRSTVSVARLPAVNGARGTWRVRAVGPAGSGPDVASAPVAARALRARLVGPRDGASVRGRATYAIRSSVPVRVVSCRAVFGSARCTPDSVTARGDRARPVLLRVRLSDALGNVVVLRRTFVSRFPR